MVSPFVDLSKNAKLEEEQKSNSTEPQQVIGIKTKIIMLLRIERVIGNASENGINLMNNLLQRNN